MILILKGCRLGAALSIWLATWCLAGVSNVQQCRATLDLGLTFRNQQPGAFLTAVDWGMNCRLVDASLEQQQRSRDSCGPASLRRARQWILSRAEHQPVRTMTQTLQDNRRLVDSVLQTAGRGCSLGEIHRAATRLGLQSSLVSVHDLKRVAPPAILHLRRGHFVLLENIRSHTVQIFDPAHGVLRLQPQQLAAQLSGAALQFAHGTRQQTLLAEESP